MKINQLSFLLFAAVLLFSCGKTILPSDDDNEDETEKHSPSHSPNEAKIYTVSEFIKETLGIMKFGYMVILLVLANEASSRLNGNHLSRMTLQSY